MQALLLGFFLGFLLPSVDSAVNTTGDQTVLVVAVKITNPSQASWPKENITERVFGDTTKPKKGWPDMASVYQNCSHGKLKIVKANGREPANDTALPDGNSAEPITNGSTTVTLSTFTNVTELEKQLKDTLQKQFKVEKIEDLADHIILCFPPGFINTSYTNGQLIRMSNNRCLDPFVLAHEFGHSIGLRHSGEVNSSEELFGYNKLEYGDESCMMGHAFLKNSLLQEKFEDGSVRVPPLPVCFNGAKSWQLGWFEDKYLHTFKADNKTWEGKLIGQVDYNPNLNGTEFKIILKLEDLPGDYYIMFHRVPGDDFPAIANYDNNNTVTIVNPKTPGGNVRSNLEKVLRANETFQKDNFKVTVKSIEINENQVPAFAEVAVEMLGQVTAVPTSTPPTTSPPTTSLPTATTTTAMPTSTPPTTSPPTTSLPTATTTTAVPTTAEPTGSPSSNLPTTTVPTARPTTVATQKATSLKSASTGKSGKSMLGKSASRGKSGKSIQNTSKSGKSKLGKSTSGEPV